MQDSAPPAPTRAFSPLAAPLYVLGLLFLIAPSLEVAVSVLGGPENPNLARWRFGAVGLATNELPLLLLGVVLLLAAARLKEHRWVARIVGAFSGLAALTIVAAIVIMTLDALQVRGEVAQPIMRAYDITVARALITMVLSVVTLLLATVASFRLLPRRPKKSTQKGAAVVGGRATSVPDTAVQRG